MSKTFEDNFQLFLLESCDLSPTMLLQDCPNYFKMQTLYEKLHGVFEELSSSPDPVIFTQEQKEDLSTFLDLQQELEIIHKTKCYLQGLRDANKLLPMLDIIETPSLS